VPGKSKRTTNNAVADYESLDDMLAELRAQDIRDGRTQDSGSSSPSSSSSGSRDDAASGDISLEEARNAMISKTEVDQWLLETGKASVNEADAKGRTPLWIAAKQGDMEMVRWFVKIGKADIDQADNKQGSDASVCRNSGGQYEGGSVAHCKGQGEHSGSHCGRTHALVDRSSRR
jgi:ankyrin repeat protein